jgi:hypothetical protein
MRPRVLLITALLVACAAPEEDAAPRPPSPAPSLVDSSGDATPEPEEAPPPVGEADATAGGEEGEDVRNADSEPEEDAVLGSVAGSEITAEELLVEWHTVASRDVWLVLEKLVTTKLAFAEAQRLGLRLEPEVVQLRVAEESRRLAQVVADSGESMTVEEYVRVRMGVKPETYFARVRVAAIRQMIAERVVRAATLESETARVRVIVVSSLEAMQAVEADLALGQEFADVARARSEDDSAGDGGLLPFFPRAEGSPLAIAAFAARPGERVGPIELADRHVLLTVEAFHAPETVSWDTHAEILERSLREHPIRDGEFLAWKTTMEERYPIDLRRLEDLFGLDR